MTLYIPHYLGLTNFIFNLRRRGPASVSPPRKQKHPKRNQNNKERHATKDPTNDGANVRDGFVVVGICEVEAGGEASLWRGGFGTERRDLARRETLGRF